MYLTATPIETRATLAPWVPAPDAAANGKPGGILLPFDGSPASIEAVKYVARHVLGTGIAVHLINVQDALLPDPALLHAARAKMAWHRDEGHRQLRVGRDILAAHGIPHTFEVAFGREAETIARVAASRGYRLVVMGTRGRHPLVNLVAGSVPSGVMRMTKVPVLLVRKDVAGDGRSSLPIE